ncbi:Protein involved in initiation of plasmid replication [hydrothermal vent metagenome]|uniref:Protein involved in initiation of plasmid replication n=1 Tax=hydrothermal vent metagenome TaxID=652676 RepID=A0A1W1BAI4_9ZZZZ
MLSMNSNTIIIDKHSSSIQISNKITAIQRKSYNYMLKIAKNELQKNSNARKFTVTADELLIFFGFGSKHHSYLEKELDKLRKIDIKYNILGKDSIKQKWGSFALIAGYQYKKGVIEYSFPHQIEEMILNPKMFAKINLVTIKGLKSKYSIALYELAEDYLNVQIPKISLEQFKELMGLEEKQYQNLKDLKRRVISVAIDEINSSENISFTLSYELEKTGRKITHIKFIVHKKEDVLELKDRQKKFYAWKSHIIKEYKGQTICNNLTELKYLKWTLFYINKDGFLGKIVDENRTILNKEESFKVWEYLYQNPSKMTIVPLTQFDILQKDFIGKKIEHVTTTVLGNRSVTVLEICGFREDKTKEEEFFFIEIQDEHGNKFWGKKSFSFYEIIEMDFL